MSERAPQPSIRKSPETEIPKPPQERETTSRETPKQRPEEHVALGELTRHRTETFVRLFDGADEDTREVLERLQPQFEGAVGSIIENVQQLLARQGLSEGAEREARLDILSQFSLLEGLTNDEQVPLEKKVQLKQTVEAIHTEIAALHFHEVDNVNPEAMKRAIEIATSRQKGGASYGDLAQKLGDKIRRWVDRHVQQTTEFLRSKTSSERLQDMLDRIGKSPLPGKIAFGATALTIGLFAIGRGEAFADVDVSVDQEKGTMTLEKEGETPITLAPLAEFGTTRQEAIIEDATFEQLRTREETLAGVNYTIENPEQFQQFIHTEMQRLLPTMNSEGIVHTENLQEMTPREIVLIATRIVEENLSYDRAANQDTAENNTISTMPLDRMLMEYKQGVCRHYAALVEKVSEMLLEQSENPGNRNIFVDEIKSLDMRHGWNILTEIQSTPNGDRAIRMSFLDATFDDQNQSFSTTLDALDEEHPNRLILVQEKSYQSVGEEESPDLPPRFFTTNEAKTILTKIIDASKEGSSEYSWACREMAERLHYDAMDIAESDEQKKEILEQVREYARRAGAMQGETGQTEYIAEHQWREANDWLTTLTEDVDEKIKLRQESLSIVPPENPWEQSAYSKDISRLYEQKGDIHLARFYLQHALDEAHRGWQRNWEHGSHDRLSVPDLPSEFLSFHERHQQYDDGFLWFQKYTDDLEESLSPENPLIIQERLQLTEYCIDHARDFNETTREDVERTIQEAKKASQTIEGLRGIVSDFTYELIQDLAQRVQQKIVAYENNTMGE